MSQISKIMLECLANNTDIGNVHVKVESLMAFEGWINPEKAKEHFETIVEHVKKLPKPFLDAEGGWTFLNLPFYDNGHGGLGEQWGEQMDAGCLIVICSHYGIFQDPLHTLGFNTNAEKSLEALPGNVTYCAFNVEREFLNLVRSKLGLKPELLVRTIELLGEK